MEKYDGLGTHLVPDRSLHSEPGSAHRVYPEESVTMQLSAPNIKSAMTGPLLNGSGSVNQKRGRVSTTHAADTGTIATSHCKLSSTDSRVTFPRRENVPYSRCDRGEIFSG